MPDSDNVFDPRKIRELRNLTVTGTLSLRGSGKLETIAGYSAGGAVRAIVITAAAQDRVTFYSGVAAETAAAYIQTYSIATVPYLSIFSPTASGVYTAISLINTAVIVTGNTLIQGHLSPNVSDNTYDLGDATVSWRNLYAYNIYDEAGTLRFDLSGNITCAGTITSGGTAVSLAGHVHPDVTAAVPGFMTADQFTKLAGIETAATADQTAAEILAALLTVDGAGSTLDADLLDGSSSAAFAAAAHDHAYLTGLNADLGDIEGDLAWAITNTADSSVFLGDVLVSLRTWESAAWQARLQATIGGGIRMHDADGTIRMDIVTDGVLSLNTAAGVTAFEVAASGANPAYIYVGSALRQVTAGADNSGGAGYKLLLVPN